MAEETPLLVLKDPGQPVNLTANLELAGRGGERASTEVLRHEDLAFSIHGLDGILAIAPQAEATVLYIIISGFGVLRCANGARLEFTEGDLIMVPSGATHRFEEVSPKFKTWRIVLGSRADGAG